MANLPQGKAKAGRIAGRHLARFVKLVHRTSTAVAEPEGILERLAHDHPCIVGLWHGQFMMASMHRPDVPVAAMVARHGDAELIGATMESLGVELVRGAGAGGRKKDRGGASALRGALQCLASGKSFVMTADVPPGPARRCGEGIVTLARMSGRPIVPLAVATSRYVSLDTWSRLTINLPYSKLAFVYGEAIHVPRDCDAAALERYRLEVERSLNAATQRAYALAGADPSRATPRTALSPDEAPPPGMSLKTYRVLTRVLAPLAPLVLNQRARKGKEDPSRQGERLGHASRERPPGPLAWVHAASVGETNAVLPLIDRLRQERQDLSFLVTTGTVTSAGLAASRLGPRAIHQFVPIDSPQAAARFLDHWRPDVAIFTESEIWPNLILATAERKIPLALVNARMSARSHRRWRRRKGISQPLFGRFAVVLAQNDKLCRQFAALGAPKVEAAGNLKIDAPPPPADAAARAKLQAAIGDRPIIVAASTHDGEEAIIAGAHRALSRQLPGLLTILAPRHPERGPGIAEDLKACGLKVAQRSQGALPGADTDVYVADTIGELGVFYSLAKVVFLGGTLIPHGGQNPIEAIRHGAVVIAGPSQHNFSDIFQALHKARAFVEVEDADSLSKAAHALLTDEGQRRQMREAGERTLQSLGGALERTAKAILPLLPPGPKPSPDEHEASVAEPDRELRRAVS